MSTPASTPASTPFQALGDVDRLVHEPARLAVLTALQASGGADFLFLQRLTGLTKGNLSSHLARLEAAGLVAVDKRFEGRTPVTSVRLTDDGRRRTEAHWERLARVRRDAAAWRDGGSAAD